MRGVLLLPAVAASLGAALIPSPPAFARRSPAAPVLVELFTAQGCASCPGANAFLGTLAERAGVVALTFPVDYWDYLGWRDTFAEPGFGERQRAYVARLKVREIYTPEIVVNGRSEAPGQNRAQVEALIKAAASRGERSPAVQLLHGGRRLTVSPSPGGGSEDVWLVRYDPAEHDVQVKSGDNKGKLVSQRNVVRDLTRLGRVTGRNRSFVLPPSKSATLKTVVLVQRSRGGAVLSTVVAPRPT